MEKYSGFENRAKRLFKEGKKTVSVKNIEVGNGPHGIRASKDSRWIYVTVTKDNIVAVINTETMMVEKKILVKKFPFWVAVQGNP